MKRALPLLLTPFLPCLAALLSGIPTGAPVAAWALPLLAPLTLYPVFLARVRERDYFGAWRLGILWALLLSAGVVALVLAWPKGAAVAILHGEAYRHEMFGWIANGIAPENDWRQFLPVHLLHVAVFVVATWATAGYLGLAMGAGLVGYMSYFVGSYAAVSGHPVLGALAAWVPWSVLRVLAFVLLGAVFSRPLLVRRVWPFTRFELQLMGLAASGIVADLLIKASSAPTYGLFLRDLAHGAVVALYSCALRTPL